MTSAEELANMLKDEGETNATLTDSEVQFAIDTVGADCAIADVRKLL